MLKNSRKTHVVDQNLEIATTKTDPKKASGRQVSRLARTTRDRDEESSEMKPRTELRSTAKLTTAPIAVRKLDVDRFHGRVLLVSRVPSLFRHKQVTSVARKCAHVVEGL